MNTKIKDANTILSLIGEALLYQDLFEKKIAHCKVNEWTDIKEFKIDLKKLDRLYHILFVNNNGERLFNILGRMDYNGKSVFVEMNAGCVPTGFDSNGDGVGIITVSTNANQFIKAIENGFYNPLIYQFIFKDEM